MILGTKNKYLRMVSRALWYSCSARSYSRDRIWTCSNVQDMPVLSLPLLQQVNRIPMKWLKKLNQNRFISLYWLSFIGSHSYIDVMKYHLCDEWCFRLVEELPHFCSFDYELHFWECLINLAPVAQVLELTHLIKVSKIRFQTNVELCSIIQFEVKWYSYTNNALSKNEVLMEFNYISLWFRKFTPCQFI